MCRIEGRSDSEPIAWVVKLTDVNEMTPLAGMSADSPSIVVSGD